MNDQLVQGKASCFIEAFDSVRFSKNSLAALTPRMVQAELELMYSILLGQQVLVPEFHSFDSLGFLEIATDVLKTRPKDAQQDWVRHPFLLSLREGKSSYLDMVSQSFSASFELSALPGLDKDREMRDKISGFLSKANFKSAENEAKNVADDRFLEFLKQIRELHDYFSEAPIHKAKQLGPLMNQYIEHLATSDSFPEQLVEEKGFRELRAGLNILKAKEVNCSKRTEVREQGKKHITDESVYLGIVEYVDSCYNAVVYKALEATTGVLTTLESTSSDYVILAQKLSEESASLHNADRVRIWIDTDCNQLDKWVKNRSSRWKKIWGILTDDRWIKSSRNLLLAPDEQSEFWAYKYHLKTLRLLSQDLPGLSFSEAGEHNQEMNVVINGNPVASLIHLVEPEENVDFRNDDGIGIDGSTPGKDYIAPR